MEAIRASFCIAVSDFSPKDLSYTLLRGNSPIGSGKVIDLGRYLVTNGFLDFHIQLSVTQPDKYSLQIQDTSYSIQNRRGSARVTATFDLRNNDKNPPTLVSFNILDGNEYTDIISSTGQAKIRFG